MILMSGVYVSLNSSTLEHDQENLLEWRLFIFSLNCFSYGSFGNSYEPSGCHSTSVSLGFISTRDVSCGEQMGLCTTACAKEKSLKAVQTAQPAPPVDLGLYAVLTPQPPRQTLGHTEPS